MLRAQINLVFDNYFYILDILILLRSTKQIRAFRIVRHNNLFAIMETANINKLFF